MQCSLTFLCFLLNILKMLFTKEDRIQLHLSASPFSLCFGKEFSVCWHLTPLQTIFVHFYTWHHCKQFSVIACGVQFFKVDGSIIYLWMKWLSFFSLKINVQISYDVGCFRLSKLLLRINYLGCWIWMWEENLAMQTAKASL